jgi:hypothetical protein
MFFQRQALTAVDLAVEPVEFVAPEAKSREGADADSAIVHKEEQVYDDDGAGQEATLQDTVTRSGQTVSKPACFIEEIGATAGNHKIGLSMSEIRCHAAMKEFPTGKFALSAWVNHLDKHIWLDNVGENKLLKAGC